MKICGMIWIKSNDNEILKIIVTLFNGFLNFLKIKFVLGNVSGTSLHSATFF
jgi:hypothetical protein